MLSSNVSELLITPVSFNAFLERVNIHRNNKGHLQRHLRPALLSFLPRAVCYFGGIGDTSSSISLF